MAIKGKETSSPKIGTLAEYLSHIERTCNEKDVLFRGQREETTKGNDLLPKIARRGIPTKMILDTERGIFEEFKRKAIPYVGANFPRSDWEWLTVSQHHGVPTRLLDWTRNPLAALWFIVGSKPKDYRSYGTVWIFTPHNTDFVDTAKDQDPFGIKRTMVYEPSHIARRITAQAACFTVHKYLDEKGKFIPLNRNSSYLKSLTKIVVPGKHYQYLREQLDRCGINEATLFADLDSLAKHVAWKEMGELPAK